MKSSEPASLDINTNEGERRGKAEETLESAESFDQRSMVIRKIVAPNRLYSHSEGHSCLLWYDCSGRL